MGYTHYWYRPKEIPKDAWTAWTKDIKRLTAVFLGQSDRTYRVAQEHDNNPWQAPTVTASQVRFNGYPREQGHETFHVERVYKDQYGRGPKPDGTFFAFCKTARKPYDDLVVACLVALKHHFPEVIVSSDGEDKDWRTGAWEPATGGIPLCQEVLDYGQEYYVFEGTLQHKPVMAVSVA